MIFEDILNSECFDTVRDESDLSSAVYDYIEEYYPLMCPELSYDNCYRVQAIREGPHLIGHDYDIETTQELEDEFKEFYPEETL